MTETTTISGRPDATLPLTGNERVVMDQGTETVDAPVSAIVALAAGNTDLDYDPATRQIKSSTGADATLPLAGPVDPGLMTAADKARLDELGVDDSPSFAGLTITGPSPAIIPHIHGDLAGNLYFHVKNTSGIALTKGTPVTAGDSVGNTNVLQIVATDPATPGAEYADGLLRDDLPINGEGHAIIAGELQDANTAAYTRGPVYVGASGGLSSTRPASRAQQVATLGRQHAVNGSLLVAIQGLEPTPAQIGADPAGTAASAMSAHLAAADPHAQYTTPSEAAAAAPVQSVAGRTGAVTLVPSDVGAQPVDSDLTAIAALTTTTFGRGLLTTADAAAARTAIGAGTSDLATAGTGTEVQYRNGTALGAIPGSVVDGATGAVQLAGLGAGVSPKPGYSVALGSGVLPRAQVIAVVGSTYTCDIRAASRFLLSAAIAGNTTIAFSNVADLAVTSTTAEYVEVEVDFFYTSGIITISAAGFTTKWDGNTAATLTASEFETLVVRITPAVTGTPFSTATVYVAPMRGRT
jgi:hypothetical protein